MSVTFDLKWTIKPRIRKRVPPHDLVDASELFLCLRRFLAQSEGEFVLSFGSVSLTLDLDPDLSTVFEDLPDVLETLSVTQEVTSEIVFYEQGTDVTLELRRMGPTLSVIAHVGEFAGVRFRHLSQPESAFSVQAREFISEWCRFVTEILDKLRTFDAKVAETESFRTYATRIAAVRRPVVGRFPEQRRIVAHAHAKSLQGIKE